jgi:hypothetical protein
MVLVAGLLVGVPYSAAELSERGDLFVHFQGGLAPTTLPRHRLAPISVGIGGTIKTLSGERPPALRTMRVALNRGGRLDTRGLPVCRYGQIVASASHEAFEACGGALVGEGDYIAKTAFPEQATFPSNGHILAFNAIYHQHRAILAHIYGTDPVPITRIVVFHIHHLKDGPFGTVITGELSEAVNRYGYLTKLALRFHRVYSYRGQTHSFLSAACRAPAGISRAAFPFARASMSFADGRRLSSTLVRTCQATG